MALINFGSINIDHVYRVHHFVQPGETLSSDAYNAVLGGKGANQSIAAANAGMHTIHVGALGASDMEFIAPLKQAGVDCSHVRALSDSASGHAIIQVNQEAENAILLFGGANQCLSDDQIAFALANAKQGDWVLMQNETNAIDTVITQAKAKGLNIAFNPAPMTQAVKSLPLDKIDLLIVNEIEAQQLSGKNTLDEAKSALKTQFQNTKVLLTMGKDGACFFDNAQNDADEHELNCPAFEVAAIDTTAAGDTFIGFFLAAISQELSIADALRRACAASAIAVTVEGAAPSIPSAQQVDAFLAQF